MEFENEAQRATFEDVKAVLFQLFGEDGVSPDEDGSPFVLVTRYALPVNVLVLPWLKEKSVISLRAYLTTRPELSPELLEFLLRKNSEMFVGAFGIDNDGDVFFEHNIAGHGYTKEIMKDSVLAVAINAEKYESEIASRRGGRGAGDE